MAYPYPSGSWNEFIDYGRSNSTNKTAGFEYKFGYANLINYWLEQKNSYAATPDLWKVSAQPVTALKDAVDVFMDYIREVDTNDRVGLVVYDASNGNAKLETGLTTNLDLIPEITRQRQAGHYHDYTNIGAGMQTARRAPGRQRPHQRLQDDRADDRRQRQLEQRRLQQAAAQSHVLSEASADAALAVSGRGDQPGCRGRHHADARVADITESRHFNVPAGTGAGSTIAKA